MTMSQYCQSCSKYKVCMFTAQVIPFVDTMNERFSEQFSDSYIADMMTIEYKCREYSHGG